MKRIIFLLAAMFGAFSLTAQKPIIIRGIISNCPNPNSSRIEKRWFNPERLEEERINTDFSISKDGNFKVEIPDADNTYVRYWISLGNENTHLDLIAGDNLYMTSNANVFDESIKYTGIGAERNNYRRDVFLEFWDINLDSKVNDHVDINSFLTGLKNLTERKLELLDKHFEAGKIDSSYYQFEKKMIAYEKANHIIDHNLRYHNHNHLPYQAASQIDSILKAVSFNDDRFLQFNEFRDLILQLPRYVLNQNSEKPVTNLKQEIEYANGHYTHLMNLFFDKELIRRYMRKTQSLSEKAALLTYFDQQFNEPVLKKEIQRQRSFIRSQSFANSDVFKITLITVFMVVMMVGLALLLVKVVQYTSHKNIRINLALILKYSIFTLLLFAAIAYLTHNAHSLRNLVQIGLVLGCFFSQAFFFIPNYALSEKRKDYFKSLVATLLIFVGGLMITESRSVFIPGIVHFFFGIIIASWILFYIHWLATKKQPVKSLITNGYLNPELAINTILVFLVNSIFVANMYNSNAWGQVISFYAILFLFYFHTFFTFPGFFRKDKIAWFIGLNAFILLIISAVITTLDVFQSQSALKSIGIEKTIWDLLSFRYFRMDILFVFLLILVPSFVYYFVRNQFKNLETKGFKLYRKKEAELAHLRSQVNPHFLFNTLNTLYAFALKEGSEKTAECIAKLANLMRFMLDDMECESILLEREVSYIQDYVKLQSIRSAVEHDIEVNVDIEPEGTYSIAPMLFIPFVENAFKHGMNPNKLSHLKIDIAGSNNQVQFVIENSIDDTFEAYYKEKGFGIGIENVKSRLAHIYPGRHNLSIAKTNGKFIVILTIFL